MAPRTAEMGLNLPILPNEIVLNILSRLPAKTLCRFRCVSKQWMNTISEPHFIFSHRLHSLQNPNLLLLRCSPATHETDLLFPQKKCVIDISATDLSGQVVDEFSLTVAEASVDMLPSRGELIFFVGEKGFYVCNPSTRELVKLPEASHCTSGEVNAGLGYDPLRNEYVLVHLFDRSLNDFYDIIGCEILRFSDGGAVGSSCCWRVVEEICPFEVRGWGVLADNAFYWMIFDTYDQLGNEAILCFDLEKEEFGTLLPPQGIFDPKAVWFLAEFKGFLCLVDNETRPFTMDIWMMKDRQNHQWVKEYSIDLNGFGDIMPKFIIPLDHMEGEILMDAKQESVNSYDIKSRSVRRMDKLIQGGWTWLRIHTDSFFSLGSR
ncbi:hypothetical protein FEM48_Zijuj05G0007900 [Ziziphus jujuba var. spinosa]|uniref:F-box domain-containing protein n=1 Tax=Ziziphus jujuba var. spinosa TaxID=714518 RepID=A0A978VBT9_ZIZJJ|nr:hypothetical protein FEM48_Zijuj05G0007900 [Ziziphus jujuba var. spinosa]